MEVSEGENNKTGVMYDSSYFKMSPFVSTTGSSRNSIIWCTTNVSLHKIRSKHG